MELRRVLVGVDGSESATHALRNALSLIPASSPLRIAHVVNLTVQIRGRPPYVVFVHDGIEVIARIAHLLKERGGAGDTVQLELPGKAGDIAETLIRDANRWGAHLMVMGTHGRYVVPPWLLGSVARQTLRRTRHPVLLCPSACAPVRGDGQAKQADTATSLERGAIAAVSGILF